MDIVPVTRREKFLKAFGGGSGAIEPLTVTENGTYTPPEGVDGYSPVSVNVPIPGGYIKPSGTQEITQNGTYDITEKASVAVNVEPPKSDLDTFIERRATDITSGAESVGDRAFYYFETLNSVNLPNATAIDEYAFTYCYSLVNIHCPNVQSIANNAFENCKELSEVDLPKCTSLGVACFRMSYRLKTIVLRVNSVCSLGAVSTLYQCYHFHGTVNATYNPEGLKDGYIYVPSALVDSYKTATNWSTFADQFRALEDYTVDGTVTGELDETKI